MSKHTEQIYWVLPIGMFIAGLASGGFAKALAPLLLWLAAGGSSFYWLVADTNVMKFKRSALLNIAAATPLFNVVALGYYIACTRRPNIWRPLSGLFAFFIYAVAANITGSSIAKRCLTRGSSGPLEKRRFWRVPLERLVG